MARKLNFMLPVERWSGKMAPKKHFVGDTEFRQGSPYVIGVVRNNGLGTKQFYSIRTKPMEYTLTEDAQAARVRFKAIAERVRTAYATEATLNTYRAQYKASPDRENITLRKFIWDAETALYEASNP